MYKLSLLRTLKHHLLTKAVPQSLTFVSHASWNTTAIKLRVVPVQPITPKTYIEKNEALKRVLSPHLSILKMQLTSVMSISLRMTGLVLGLATWMVALTGFLPQHSVDYYVNALENFKLDHCYWTAAKIVIAFPFAFHCVAGVRHLSFDTSKLMEKSQFYATGYAALAVIFILALYLGMIEEINCKLGANKQGNIAAGKEK